MPLFSVIIPNYNHAAYLVERIESILKQTFRDFEVIILDDCSTDNSQLIIEHYRSEPAVSHILYNEKNSGSPFIQWKKGMEMAKGEWIWVAESDDIADPHFLEEATMKLKQFSSAGLFYCDGIIKTRGGAAGNTFSFQKNRIFKTQRWSSSWFQNGVAELNDYLKFDNTINNASGVVFKKSIAGNIIQNLEAFTYYGDWWFYLQLCLTTDICYSNKPLNIYRKHEKSLLHFSISSFTSRKEYFLILQSLYYNEKVTNKKELLNHFCYHFLNLGLFSHSFSNSFKIVKEYFRIDKTLASKVTPRLIWMKLFRKSYKKRILQIEYIEE